MNRTRVSALVAGASVVIGTALSAPAMAADVNPYDPVFVPNLTDDLVGAGSDTTQIVVHDIATAYNEGRTSGRIASFAALGDPASVVLRQGREAITRPNGSSAGKRLLYAPNNNPDVSFARSSSTLSSTEIGAGLRQAAFAVDGLQLAVSSSATNAPASLTMANIVAIYKGDITNWNQVGGSNGAIKPLIPQSGSGTRSFFLEQLKAANGGVDVPLAVSVGETQEHSDEDVKDNPNAIAPFSTARANTMSTVSLRDGWKAERAVYHVFRNEDLADPVRGPQLQSIFGEDGWICGPDGRAVLEDNGFEQLASTANGGKCGELVTAPVNDFKTSGEFAADTTTGLTAAAPGGQKVTLRATVAAYGRVVPAGQVEFYEGDVKVGTGFTAGGVATVNLTNVGAGEHTYTAQFTPTVVADFNPSESAAQSIVVKAPASVTVTGAAGVYGKAKQVTVKAVVNGQAATGSVSVKVGSAAAKSFTLVRGSVVVPIAATTPAGTVPVVATLAGTSTADAATGSLSLRIAKAKAKATSKLAKKKIKASKRGTITVTVKPVGAAKGVNATGKVTIRVGKKVVGTGKVRNGKAKIKLAKLARGTHKLVATYNGSTNVTKVKAKTVKLTVTK